MTRAEDVAARIAPGFASQREKPIYCDVWADWVQEVAGVIDVVTSDIAAAFEQAGDHAAADFVRDLAAEPEPTPQSADPPTGPLAVVHQLTTRRQG